MATYESRPSQPEAAPEKRLATHSQDTGTAPIPHLSAAEREAALTAYVLLLKSPTDRLSRRLFLSLPAAMRAAERAQQRGSAVHLELFYAVPAATIDGGQE